MTSLVVSELSVRRGGAPLVDAVSWQLKPGELVALLGANGAGKTTLLRGSLGLIPVDQGVATLGEAPIARLDPAQRARSVAYLPQMRPLAWPNRVRDIVALGRFAHGMTLGRMSPLDAAAVDRAISACDLSALAERRADLLSGGELARVHCARAFATEAPLLLADEPVAALDPRHQHRILSLVRNFVNAGGGALVVLHDIQMAARYADRLLWMREGQMVADGTPQETLTADRLAAVYGVRARVDGLRVDVEGSL